MPIKSFPNLPKGTIVPNHIAIILDGNGRWARARGLDSTEGHKMGYKAMREVIRASRDLGVHTLTVWGFSTENWSRPDQEVRKIMRLVVHGLRDLLDEADREGVRFVHIGRKDRLPKIVADMITRAENKTKNNKNYILNVALDYGGRDEIVRAARKIVDSGVSSDKIDEELFAQYLDTADQPYPYPDLLIRTSGEQRTSGFLPWQITYAEIYWEQDHLPDMTTAKLVEAILDYSRRRRRFGGKDLVGHLKFKPEVIAKFELAWWRLGRIPEGTKFSEYALNHIKEQYGLSVKLASEASKFMVQAIKDGDKKDWQQANRALKKFYKLIKEEVKLTFEPSIVASIDVKLMQKTQDKKELSTSEIEDLSTELVAEVYRISEFQAAKAGHLRALAAVERSRAELGMGEVHWQAAKEYLELYYKALKDRVA